MADIIDFPAAPEQSSRRHEPLPLPAAAERARRLIELARDHLDEGNRTGARVCLDIAEADLGQAVHAAVEDAIGDLGTLLMTAAGPVLTVAEVRGARKLLGLLLTALPVVGELRP